MSFRLKVIMCEQTDTHTADRSLYLDHYNVVGNHNNNIFATVQKDFITLM